jgi:O-antigen/teichoic acid export membrane protein
VLPPPRISVPRGAVRQALFAGVARGKQAPNAKVCPASVVPVSAPGRPGETPEQRDDRNLIDLLQELRVATLGVQVLFGFLLGLPFTARFAHLHSWQRGLYLATVVLSSSSVALLVAPVAYHRVLFRRHQLGYLLRAANVLAISGMVAVALAVTCAVLLVTSFVEPGAAAITLSAVVALLFTGVWFVAPLARRSRLPPESDSLGSGADSADQ